MLKVKKESTPQKSLERDEVFLERVTEWGNSSCAVITLCMNRPNY